jgi:ADP-heptose:LPS heptosyltransferase
MEDKLVLLHPGSGSPKKLWSPAGWLSLVDKMVTRGKTQLVLVEGPADSHIVQNLRSHLKIESHIHLDNWPLGRLAAFMGHADLYIGNDSGITHLAAACGTATIALFGPTDPNIWAPKGSRVEVIRWRSNSSGYGFPATAKDISEPPPETELVWKKTRRFLGL